ncbi:MAG: thioredoxin family protein [Burkholderiales bacterium]|nr:thioredoxin family protein [Burkholderiales bacterium]
MSLVHASIPTSTQPPLLVACLCAQWCRTCDEYQPLFVQLQKEFPHARFQWVDIEDEADLVDPIEVENFPTILIATAGKAGFFGTVTPHIDTLRRLIQAQLESGGASVQVAEAQALANRLGVQAG